MVSRPSYSLLRPFDIQPDGREAIQLSAALWIGAALFVSIGSIFAGHIQSLGEYLSIITGLVSAVTIAYGVYWVFMLVAGRPRWIAYLALACTVPAAAVLQIIAEYALYWWLSAVFDDVNLPDHDAKSLLLLGAIYFCLYSANVTLLWVTSANRANHVQAERLAQARGDLLQAELDALRLKLDPHFMFNALSAAISLIETDRKAESVATLYRLAHLLETAFDTGPGDIPLDDEMSILADYMAVSQVRFPHKLRYETRLDAEAGGVEVPSFLLQPLVENAVKYAVEPSLAPVTVTVAARKSGSELVMTVEDQGSDAGESPAEGTGVGHAATRSRLALRYGDRATFEAGPTTTGYLVRIKIPC